jgi:HlyD family secretion protein
MNKKWIVWGVILAVVVLSIVVKVSRGTEAKKVEIETVSMRVLTPSILASGKLSYKSQVSLTPEISGRVKEIFVQEGEFVKQDQLLLRLDSAQALAQIAQIEAQIRQSELTIERRTVDRDAQVAKWKRYQALSEKGVIEASRYDDFVTAKDMAEVDLRTSREQLTQMQASLKQSRESLAKTEIRSPISGKVTAIYIKVGETAVMSMGGAIAGSRLMEVADTTSVFAEVNIDETDVARVRVGAAAKIVPAAFPDKSLSGTVDQVAIWPQQVAGSQNKSYLVKIQMTAAEGISFHPGMSCRAEVSASEEGDKQTLAVPVQAVKYEDAENKKDKQKASVFVVKDKRVSKREIETGTADDSYIAVTKGLAADEVIVTGPVKSLLFLRDGESVAPQSANATNGSQSSAKSN